MGVSACSKRNLASGSRINTIQHPCFKVSNQHYVCIVEYSYIQCLYNQAEELNTNSTYVRSNESKLTREIIISGIL